MEGTERWFRILFRVGILALFIWMIGSLLTPVILGAVLALLLHPVNEKLTRKLGRLEALAPALITFGALLLIVAPLTFAAAEGIASIQQFMDNLNAENMNEVQSNILRRITKFAAENNVNIPILKLREEATGLLRRAGS